MIDRLSFRRFVGLSMDHNVPDFTTFGRFNEVLAGPGLVVDIYSEINRQLQAKGLFLKQGTVVDITIIESAKILLKSIKCESAMAVSQFSKNRVYFKTLYK